LTASLVTPLATRDSSRRGCANVQASCGASPGRAGRIAAVPPAGVTLWPSSASEKALARLVACATSSRLAFAATAATTMREAMSWTAYQVWSVSWLITRAPPARTRRTKTELAIPAATPHRSETRPGPGHIRRGEHRPAGFTPWPSPYLVRACSLICLSGPRVTVNG
jgi:hypothetical protein